MSVQLQTWMSQLKPVERSDLVLKMNNPDIKRSRNAACHHLHVGNNNL